MVAIQDRGIRICSLQLHLELLVSFNHLKQGHPPNRILLFPV